jgi:hypothetical protein
VAFLDEQLVTYRYSAHSLTRSVQRRRTDWLDRLWTLEMLMSFPKVRVAVPDVDRLWRDERRMARRTVLRHAVRPKPDDPPVRLWWAYARYRTGRLLRRSAESWRA